MQKWRDRLLRSKTGEWTSTIISNLDAWCNRKAELTFHMTQIMSGHGCFGDYLQRIGKEQTASCHHCPANIDNAKHTLEQCPAWDTERKILLDALGCSNDSREIVTAALSCQSTWTALNDYCQAVMKKKEDAERIRRGERLLL